MSRDDRRIADATVGSLRVPELSQSSNPAQAGGEPPAAASGQSRVAATLVAIEGDLKGEAFTLAHGANHLGRGADCSPVMNSRWISRSHAHITCEDGHILLRATEGKEVFVNDARIQEESLQDGDRVRMGTTVFLLRMVTGTGEQGGSAIPVLPGRTGSHEIPGPEDSAEQEASGEYLAPAQGRKRPFWKFWEKPVPSLVFTRGPRAGERIELDKPRIRIGALNDNDIVIYGADASRNHAELRVRDGRAHIWDLRSVNGTWVNERRIENVALQFGDVIRIGSDELRFED